MGGWLEEGSIYNQNNLGKSDFSCSQIIENGDKVCSLYTFSYVAVNMWLVCLGYNNPVAIYLRIMCCNSCFQYKQMGACVYTKLCMVQCEKNY